MQALFLLTVKSLRWSYFPWRYPGIGGCDMSLQLVCLPLEPSYLAAVSHFAHSLYALGIT